MKALGIDIGGTSIKASVVDCQTGALESEFIQIDTPFPATPGNIRSAIERIAQKLKWRGPLGIGYPGVVKEGKTWSAAHMDAAWIGFDALGYLQALGDPVVLINDADAAGIAEMKFGVGRESSSQQVIFLATFGTGIGTSIFVNGALFPNTELGHIQLDGVDAEILAAASVRVREGLSWVEWGGLVNRYLQEIEKLVSPDVIIIGGGVSENYSQFEKLISVRAVLRCARLGNNAGMIGAACYAIAE